ncbi:hypothetical protein Tco_1355181 [Tanacetum coccineum]
MTNTPYPIDLNTPYVSVKYHYTVLSSQNTLYCLEEQIKCLDYRIQYVVLGRSFDTSYLTGGYAVSGADMPYLPCWILRIVYHDLYLGGKALIERENMGFDLTKSDFFPGFIKDLTMKGVGLRVADSHTGNHREDGFTPLETIRMFLGIIGSRSHSSSKGEAFEPVGRVCITENSSVAGRGWWGVYAFADVSAQQTGGGVGGRYSGDEDDGGFRGEKWRGYGGVVRVDIERRKGKPSSSESSRSRWEGGVGDGQLRVAEDVNDQGVISSLWAQLLPADFRELQDLVQDDACIIAEFAKNIGDSDDASSEKDERDIVEKPKGCHPKQVKLSAMLLTLLMWIAILTSMVVAHVTPPSWKQHLKEISLEKIYDIHDRAYMRQVVLVNMLNRRTCKLISTFSKARASCDGIREREVAKDKAYAKMERKYRAVVVSNVVPHIATKLVLSDEMGLLVTRLFKAAMFYGRCIAFEEVTNLKEPFILEKMPCYHPSFGKEFDQASDDLATASYPFIAEATADPHATMEQLL